MNSHPSSGDARGGEQPSGKLATSAGDAADRRGRFNVIFGIGWDVTGALGLATLGVLVQSGLFAVWVLWLPPSAPDSVFGAIILILVPVLCVGLWRREARRARSLSVAPQAILWLWVLVSCMFFALGMSGLTA